MTSDRPSHRTVLPARLDAMSGNPRAVDVTGLHKRYGDKLAVDGLDLHVEVGEIVAVLGPNGAGKTTTVEILEGYRHRDSGKVAVLR